ncbi:hypothetical protein NQ314_016460 [Rhamnusium bicolor]|uniref:DUF4774 domain-containing protein n=1 Tax=Rhamnusium bicolor TaxID=1586634 RepID=A0AAV8WX69_9CUCU|nr:hypothetical protein NQ314_016460 [Rhamnusium bicolor]
MKRLEKQTIIEVSPNFRRHLDNSPHPSQRKIEDNTKEILDKIAEVNKKQGLSPRKQIPSYFHFPFSYSRSQEEEKRNHERKSDNFKFTGDPFSNPIFEYLERERHQEENDQFKPDLNINREPQHYDQFQGYEKTMTNPSLADITKEDVIPGQYIKRKIVHQQTLLIPSSNFLPQSLNAMSSQNVPPYIMQTPMNFQQAAPIQPSPPLYNEDNDQTNKTGDKKNLSHLEKQTVDNVKSIVSNTQMLQSQAYPYFYNPYGQYPQGNLPDQSQYGLVAPNVGALEQQTPNDGYSYRIYGPYTMQNSDKGRQNWNWPGANYFPIYIRDPFLQMYNAITSMIEYGPNAGQNNPCNRPNKNKVKGKEEPLTREGKISNEYVEREQIMLELGEKTSPSQITIYGVDGDNSDKNNTSYLDIENLDIGTSKEDNLQFTVNLKTTERESNESEKSKELKTSWDKINDSSKYNASRPASKLEKFSENTKDFRPTSLFKPQIKPQPQPQVQAQLQPLKQPVISPPIRDPTDDAFGDEIDEEDKADDVSISNDGNKKYFSRDNTGSGIFIHKLKVRKGGVAIAGPGGIATAGSGGTAIVGPNGVAYTHPDSLAIAGSGTKVVAVDPTINLSDLISNSINTNKTSLAFPPSRIGKVVAVGPVVYYNKE